MAQFPPSRVLVAALPGDPGIQASQLPTQRRNFTDTATFRVAILVKTEQAFLVHQVLQGFMLGGHNLQTNVVMLTNFFDEPVGFCV